MISKIGIRFDGTFEPCTMGIRFRIEYWSMFLMLIILHTQAKNALGVNHASKNKDEILSGEKWGLVKREASLECRTTVANPFPSRSVPESDKPCVFPFQYKGKEFNECTTEGYGSQFWCGTTYSVGEWTGWGLCCGPCPSLPDCSAYNGIPNSSGSVCCAKNCGECGGSGCRNRPGGATKCCSGEITKTCGLNQKAPCRPPISCEMEVLPGGCSSPGNLIGRLDCRDRADFDQTYCPKSKGEGFSIDECNRHCLEMAACAIYQRNGGTCWFYGQSDPDGSNGGIAQGWKCGVKKSPGCSVPSGWRKEYGKFCPFCNKTYESLYDAKAGCDNDSNCNVIYDLFCDLHGYFCECSMDTLISQTHPHGIDCVYIKV